MSMPSWYAGTLDALYTPAQYASSLPKGTHIRAHRSNYPYAASVDDTQLLLLLPQAVSALAAATGLANLQELDLSHNHLGPGAGEVLGQLLRAAGQLLSLKLRSTALGGTSKTNASADDVRLTHSLDDQVTHGLDTQPKYVLWDFIKPKSQPSCCRTSDSARLFVCLCTWHAACAGVAGLAKGLQCSSSLRHLDLSYTQLTDAGLEALAAALTGNSQQQAAAANSPHHQPPLQQLYLGGNPDLTDTALSNLAAALAAAAGAASSSEEQPPPQQQSQQQDQQQGPQWQWQLDLAETGAGAGAVQALSVLPGLTQLSLFGCKLGAGAAGEGETTAGRQGTLGLAMACIPQGLHFTRSACCSEGWVGPLCYTLSSTHGVSWSHKVLFGEKGRPIHLDGVVCDS